MDLLQQDYQLFDGLLRGGGEAAATSDSAHAKKNLVFTDTSFVEDIVYARRAGIERPSPEALGRVPALGQGAHL